MMGAQGGARCRPLVKSRTKGLYKVFISRVKDSNNWAKGSSKDKARDSSKDKDKDSSTTKSPSAVGGRLSSSKLVA